MSTQTHMTGVQTGIRQRWLDVLDEKKVDFIVLDPLHDRKLIGQLQTRPDWMADYASEEAIVFVRQELSINHFC